MSLEGGGLVSPKLAHTGGIRGRGHDLIRHLEDVATRATEFARGARPDHTEFASLAGWAGWLHDLGKYREEFQKYLLGQRKGGLDTQHAVFGAAWSRRLRLPWAVAFSILGHHAGLPNVQGLKRIWEEPKLDPWNASLPLGEELEDDRASNQSPDWPDTVPEFLEDHPVAGSKARPTRNS